MSMLPLPRLLPLVCAAVAAAWSGVAHAQATRTWISTTTNATWSVGANWTTGTAPVANDSLAFGATTGTTTLNNNITAATQFNGITFNTGASAYTLTGNQITLGGALTNNSASLQTIALPLALSATRIFAANSGGITVTGPITGSGGITKNGRDTLTLAGTNTFSGASSVNGGTLLLDYSAGGNTADPLGTSAITLDMGTLVLKGRTTGTTTETISALNMGNNLGAANTLRFDANGGSGIVLTTSTFGLATQNTSSQNINLIDLSSSSGNSLTASGLSATASVINGVLMHTIGAGNGRANLVVRDSAGYGFATLSGATSGTLGRLTAGTTLDASNSSATTNYRLTTAGTLTRTTNLNFSTLTLDSSAGAVTLALGANNFAFDGNGRGILVTGPNDVSITGSGRFEGSASIWMHNYSTGTFTFGQSTSASVGGSYMFGGTGLTVWTGTVTNLGPTNIEFYAQGITFRPTTNQDWVTSWPAGFLRVSSGAVLEVGADLNGATAGDVSQPNVYFWGDSGVSAFGGDRVVGFRTSGTGALQSLTWGAQSFLTQANGGTDGNFIFKLSSDRSDSLVTVQNDISLGTLARTVEVADGSAAVDAELSGVLSAGAGLTKTGAGTLRLSSNNTGLAGPVTIAGGTLIIGNNGTTGALGSAASVVNNAALVFNRSNLTNPSYAISGTGSVAMIGSGTVNLSGNNSYTGGTRINAGQVNYGHVSAFGTGTVSFTGNATLQAGVTGTVANAISIGSGVTVSLDTQSFATTLSGVIGGSGNLTRIGTSTLTLSGSLANTASGTMTVSAGTLNLNKTAGVTAVAGDLAISNAIVTFGTSNQIADGAAVTMSGANSVFNGTGWNAGQILALDETIGSLVVTGGIFMPGGHGSSSTTGFVVTGSASFTGGAGNIDYTQNSGGLASFGSLTLVSMTNTAQTTGFAANRFGVSGNSTARRTTLTVGSGGLSLDGSNLLLQLGGTGALGSRLVLNGDVTTTGSVASAITAPTGEANTVGTRTVELSSTAGTVTRTFTIGGGGANLLVSFPITNGSATTAGIRKAGAGTLTLGTAATYSGATTISAGVLALGAGGSFANSPTITVGDAGSSGAVLNLTAKTGTFTFTSSQTVGGIGTINIGAGKTVSSAGIWAPGNSIGSNAVTGNLSLSGTSQFELGTPGPSTSAPGNSDFTAVSGTLTLGGRLSLINNAGADGNGSVAGGVYRLFTYGNAVSGSFASITTNPSATTRTSLGNISYGGSGTATGQGVFLSVYNLAAGSVASGTSINLGTVLKGTSLSQALSIANTAPAGSFSEGLLAAFGTPSGDATATGSISSLLVAGSSSTAMTVGLGSATPGAKSGAVAVNYTSDGAGTSGLGTVAAGSQTVNLTATVLDPAVASFASGPTAQTSLTLDFFTVNQGDVVSPQGFSLYNLLQTAGFTADLALVSITETNPTGPFDTNLEQFNTLASGTFNSWQVSLNTAGQGTFSNTWTLQFQSANAGTVYTGDTTQTLTLMANVIVVPEPGSLALAGLGIAAAFALRRRK